jgi:hypothetical protein
LDKHSDEQHFLAMSIKSVVGEGRQAEQALASNSMVEASRVS